MNKEKLFIAGIGAFVIVVLAIAALSAFRILSPVASVSSSQMPPSQSRMSLSAFDKDLAKQLMDANGDGKCDVCGMPVEMCIDSGQLQCNMDSKSTIGILGSQHIHADWKIYINENALDETFFEPLAMDMSNANSAISSSFIHVDRVSSPENVGDILHMHATGVPLWIFFESVGMKFNQNCLVMPGDEKFCSDENKRLKFYVNDETNTEYGEYVFRDGDKLLISYGDEINLSQQLNSITGFAQNH